MKHVSFVATVEEMLPQETEEIPGLAETISYWNENAYSPEEWLRRVNDCWGTAGLVMRRGEDVLGFIIFGPAEFLVRAENLAGRPSHKDTVIMASVSGDRRVKKHLLVRMMKELRHRGAVGVEAISSDFTTSQHVSTRFLIESGWRPVRRVGHLTASYTLMRADLGNAVEVGELARDIIGRVKLPRLKGASPLPGEACVQVELSSRSESLEKGKTAVLTVEIPSGVVA